MYKRRISILAYLLLFCISSAVAQQPTPSPAPRTLPELRAKILEVLAKPELSSAMVGVKVVSLDTGHVLFEENAVEKSLLAEIKKLQDVPVSAAELDKAKNQIITDQLRERETSNGKAQALGEAAVLLGDPNRVNTDLDKLQAVTAADVQRVMKKYFTDANRLVLYYLPEASKKSAEGK